MSNQNTELAESLQNYTANMFGSRHGGNNGKQTCKRNIRGPVGGPDSNPMKKRIFRVQL